MRKQTLFTAIYGPTSVGKTAYAWKLAHQYKANILSFDSRQCFVGMEIGTGVDLPEGYVIKEGVAQLADSHATFAPEIFGHGVIPPTQDWSIAHFYNFAQPIIQHHQTSQTPLILVGGSWQYLSVLFDPPASLFFAPNTEQRAFWEKMSVPELQTLMHTQSPSRWLKMNSSDRNNKVRLIRALETQAIDPSKEAPPALLPKDQVSLHVLNADLQVLKASIHKRIVTRVQQGMKEETQKLLAQYKNWKTPAFSATGYSSIARFLQGEISEAEALSLWEKQETQYLKKQQTWIRWIENHYTLRESQILDDLPIKPTRQIFE